MFCRCFDFTEMNSHLRATFYHRLFTPSSSSSSSELDIASKPLESSALVTVQMLDRFTSLKAHPDHLGLYQSFQYYCDPGTLIMVSGMIDDSTEDQTTIPSVIHSLLGHKITQVNPCPQSLLTVC
jgi:hypothetical protein